MAATSSRTLRLLSLLQAQRHWPGPDLADRLGVSVRTLRRDVDRLRGLGYPVQATRGADGGYQLAAGASLPPLALDDEEAVALAVALQSAVGSAPAFAEAALRALATTVRVMPARLRRQVDALLAATTAPTPTGPRGPDPALLLAVAQAVQAGERLTLRYTAADGRSSVRRIEPHRLVPLRRNWYLLAHDLDRADWRVFRVDRAASAVPDGSRFRPRELPDDDVAAYVRRRVDTAPWGYAVRAVLHCPADVARARLGVWAQVEDLGGGTCSLTLTTEALDWAVFALGRVGCEVSGVEPPELVEELRGWADRFGRAARR